MKAMRALIPMICLLGYPLCSHANLAHVHKKTAGEEYSNIDVKKVLSVIEGQLKELRSGNIEKAYNDYTSDSFRKTTSLDNFKKLVAKFNELSDNKFFQHQSFYVEGGVATFEGDLISKNGNTVPTEFDMIEENGSWKIMGIHLYQSEPMMPPPGTDQH